MISICGSRWGCVQPLLVALAVAVCAQEVRGQNHNGLLELEQNLEGNCELWIYAGPEGSPADWDIAEGRFSGSDWTVRLGFPESEDNPGPCDCNAYHWEPVPGGSQNTLSLEGWRAAIRATTEQDWLTANHHKVAKYIAANAPDLTALGDFINGWEGGGEEACPTISDLANWVDGQDCDGDGIPDWQDTDNCEEPEECVEMTDPEGETCWDCDGDGECDCWRVDDEGKCTCEEEEGCGCEEVDIDDDGQVDCWDCDGDGTCDCYAVDPETGECECENPEGCDGGDCDCERITDPNSSEGDIRYCWDCDGDGYCDCWQYNEEACECTCDCDPADESCGCGCEPGQKLQGYLTQMQQMFLDKLGLGNWEDLNWAGDYIVWEIPIPVPGQGYDYYHLPLVPRVGVSGPEDALHYLRIALRSLLLFLCSLWMVRKVFQTLRQY